MAQSAAIPVKPVALPAGFDLLTLHAANPVRYPFLLESVATDAGRSNDAGFDILFAFPGETLRLDQQFMLQGPEAAGCGNDFLTALDRWWRHETREQDVDPHLPFQGGWFVFLGYELVRQIEPSTVPREPPEGPVAFATRIPVGLVRSRHTGKAWIVAEDGHDLDVNLLEQDLRRSPGGGDVPPTTGVLLGPVTEPDPAAYLVAVERARQFIARGDVYQVNLARQWTATVRPGVRPADIYQRLRRTNPAPFAGIATFGDWSLISSSPERLVRSRGGRVDTRPIAGTRPTADDPGQEEAMRRDLLANPKERAEHIMLIDLERNDLGRISSPGSVLVDELMVVESYAHVHHIVSNICGQLRPGVSPGQVIRAMFPGGTITGCPKVRCMKIISELEGAPRGAYTGSMGYLNRDGSCDLNILIRTFVLAGRQISFAAGSGIVADSTPDRELAETRAKAKGLLLALEG